MEPFLQELAKSFAKRDGIMTFKSPLLCAGQRVTDGETEIQMVWVTEDLPSKLQGANFWEPLHFQDVPLLPLLRVHFCFDMHGSHCYEKSLMQF